MDRPRPKNIVSFARLVALFVCGSAAAVAGVWTGDRLQTTEAFRTEATPFYANAGGILKISYEFRRYRLCPRETQRIIIDGQKNRFDLGVQSVPVRGLVGNDSYIQSVNVPRGAAPGPSVYRVSIRDFCNPIHYLWPLMREYEIPFTILPAKTD